MGVLMEGRLILKKDDKIIDTLDITIKLFKALKDETNFAILNLVNAEGKIKLSELDKRLKRPKKINDSLNQLIDFELIDPVFERESPVKVYLSLGKAGNILLKTLEIDKKRSKEIVTSYLKGDIEEKMKDIISL